MNDLYSSNELLEIALKIEEDGKRFYDHLARSSKEKEKKEFFSYLASQEEEHEKNFKALSRELIKEMEGELWEEASKYMRSIAEGKVFPNSDEMIEKSKHMSIDEILDMAISIEKETVIFYEELYDLVKSERAKETLSRIIREEVSHVRKLSRLKS